MQREIKGLHMLSILGFSGEMGREIKLEKKIYPVSEKFQN